MIKAEDLMIGDWVHSKDYNENLQVLEIDCDYITLGEGYLHGYKDIEPIPITPKILEKNGFYPIYKDEKSAYKWKEYDDDSDDTQAIVIDFERKRLSEVWNDRTRKSYKGEIVYVHELQHIIKVCGISKTIEL